MRYSVIATCHAHQEEPANMRLSNLRCMNHITTSENFDRRQHEQGRDQPLAEALSSMAATSIAVSTSSIRKIRMYSRAAGWAECAVPPPTEGESRVGVVCVCVSAHRRSYLCPVGTR